MRNTNQISTAISDLHASLDDIPVGEAVLRLEALVMDINAHKVMDSLDYIECQRLSHSISLVTDRLLIKPTGVTEKQLSMMLVIIQSIHSDTGWASVSPLSSAALFKWLTSPFDYLLDQHASHLLSNLDMNKNYLRLPAFMVSLDKLPDEFPWMTYTVIGSIKKSALTSSIAACLYHLRTGQDIHLTPVLDSILTVSVEEKDHEHAHWFKALHERHGIIDEVRTRQFLESYAERFLELASIKDGYFRLGTNQNLAKNIRAMGYPDDIILNKHTRRILLEHDLEL